MTRPDAASTPVPADPGARPDMQVLSVLPTAGWALVLHGGAGGRVEELALEEGASYRDGLTGAYRAGAAVLAAGGSALDAVCATVERLEDDPLFNAGRGAALTADGTAELDACVMTGDGRAGAVAACRHARNPVRAARKVMEDSAAVLLVAPGASGSPSGGWPPRPGVLPHPRPPAAAAQRPGQGARRVPARHRRRRRRRRARPGGGRDLHRRAWSTRARVGWATPRSSGPARTRGTASARSPAPVRARRSSRASWPPTSPPGAVPGCADGRGDPGDDRRRARPPLGDGRSRRGRSGPVGRGGAQLPMMFSAYSDGDRLVTHV